MAHLGTPKDHALLVLKLTKLIGIVAFKKMKLLVEADTFGGFKDAELERIKSVGEMLKALQQRGIFGVGDYGKLIEIMNEIDMKSVIGAIVRTGKLTGASKDEMESKSSPRTPETRQPHSERASKDEMESNSSPRTPETRQPHSEKKHEPLSEVHLREIAHNLAEGWQELGTYLGFSASELEMFKRCAPEVDNQIFKMLVKWKRKHGGNVNEMKTEIENALKRMGDHQLASEINEY